MAPAFGGSVIAHMDTLAGVEPVPAPSAPSRCPPATPSAPTTWPRPSSAPGFRLAAPSALARPAINGPIPLKRCAWIRQAHQAILRLADAKVLVVHASTEARFRAAAVFRHEGGPFLVCLGVRLAPDHARLGPWMAGEVRPVAAAASLPLGSVDS